MLRVEKPTHADDLDRKPSSEAPRGPHRCRPPSYPALPAAPSGVQPKRSVDPWEAALSRATTVAAHTILPGRPVDRSTASPGSRRVRGVRRSSPRTKGKRRRTATSATRSTPGVGCWTLVRNSWPVAADPSTTPAAAAGLSCSTSPSPCWPRRLPERGARRRGLGAEPGAGARVDYRCQKQPSGEQVPATSSAAYAGCSATSCQWQPVRWPKQCLSLTRQV